MQQGTKSRRMPEEDFGKKTMKEEEKASES
jgi:hypothetical protein